MDRFACFGPTCQRRHPHRFIDLNHRTNQTATKVARRGLDNHKSGLQGIEESTTRVAETALRVEEVQGAVADLQRLKADKAATATAAQLQMRVQDIMEEVTAAVQVRPARPL